MLLFPNAKINLGLRVIEKRADGFHSIETVFIPVDLCDCLEFIETSAQASSIEITGTYIEGSPDDNLVLKAWQFMHRDYGIPSVSIHLHKIIPTGAGLGGGSADAAFMLKGLNEYFSCGCSHTELEAYASKIGSDCAFFIRNKPAMGTGRGEILKDVRIPLENYEVLLINPGIHIDTREAYAGISLQKPEISLNELILLPVKSWQKAITNDFEKHVFSRYPLISELKNSLIKMDAVYSSMTGSGSTVYGIFPEGVLQENEYRFDTFFCFRGKLLL
jgi:4-diphosphocytidyl-2-C-methyl-D-erythritol kinase